MGYPVMVVLKARYSSPFRGASAAAGQENGRSNRKRNFVVSNKGALSRSDLILFVLVAGIRILSRTRDEDDDEDDWSTFDFATYR
jgi:hypothetical protein